MKNKPMALWSADLTRVDGQALVTRRVVEELGAEFSTKWIYKSGRGLAMFASLSMAVSVWMRARRFGIRQVYLVCSRSTLGFIRDIPALSLSRLGIRVVVHVHGSDLINLCERPFVGKIARALYANCEVIVPSTHLVEGLQSLPVRKVHVCENFMDGDSDPIPASVPGAPLRIYWNSNVMATKGFREVAEAVVKARADGLAIRFTVIGRVIGDAEAEAEEMQKLIDSIARVEGNEIHGPVCKNKARELLKHCDVVILPSRMECQPLAIIEAMGAARQVIVADIPSLQATTKGYPAIFVELHTDCIARAIVKVSQADDVVVSALDSAAREARLRFSRTRFDRTMRGILQLEGEGAA